jgi:hypothetical protein
MRYIACSTKNLTTGMVTVMVGGPNPRTVIRLTPKSVWRDENGKSLGRFTIREMRRLLSYDAFGNGVFKSLQAI